MNLCDFYKLLEIILPFSWIHYEFMKNAFLAILLISPVLGLFGTLVISNRLSFFSDALGHSMLLGMALGLLFGFSNLMVSMLIFGMIFAMVFLEISHTSLHSQDTIIAVLSSISVSAGIILLSKNGGFAKYSSCLTGDLLVVNRREIFFLFLIFLVVLITWATVSNKFLLSSFNKNLALSKGINVKFYKNLFVLMIAFVITFFIRWVGILLVNAMLILPAAAARNISKSIKKFYAFSVIFSLISGVGGLVFSYYFGVPSGAMIVFISGLIFFVTLIFRKIFIFEKR